MSDNRYEQIGEGAKHLVWASDVVRYNDEGVEYQHAEAAKENRQALDEARELAQKSRSGLQSVVDQLENLDEECQGKIGDAVDEIYETLEYQRKVEENIETQGKGLEETKYDGISESGPGIAFLDYDGPVEDIIDYSIGVADTGIFEGINRFDRDFPQSWYDGATYADGIAVVAENSEGEKELYDDTLLMPLVQDEAEKEGGAGHKVVREVSQKFPGADVFKWSSTTGDITGYDENGEPLEHRTFEYDRDEQPRVPSGFKPVTQLTRFKDMNNDIIQLPVDEPDNPVIGD